MGIKQSCQEGTGPCFEKGLPHGRTSLPAGLGPSPSLQSGVPQHLWDQRGKMGKEQDAPRDLGFARVLVLVGKASTTG